MRVDKSESARLAGILQPAEHSFDNDSSQTPRGDQELASPAWETFSATLPSVRFAPIALRFGRLRRGQRRRKTT